VEALPTVQAIRNNVDFKMQKVQQLILEKKQDSALHGVK
jgi:hypothetical protein